MACLELNSPQLLSNCTSSEIPFDPQLDINILAKIQACLELNSPQLLSNCMSSEIPFDPQLDINILAEIQTVSDAHKPSISNIVNVPKPPPLPDSFYGKNRISIRPTHCSYVLNETKHAWERLFDEGYEADVRILTNGKGVIMAHSSVLGITSPVLRYLLEHARVEGGFRCIKIPGVPLEAVRLFIRFLYSSRYEEDDMKKFVLHFLVMSHTLSVPSLKRVCIDQLEEVLLTRENVVDVLQLARQCDAPRLSLLCTRMIVKDFKTISASEGWKVMNSANPSLEQELLELLVEADSRTHDHRRRKEERKVYNQLHETMVALLHICRDGCSTIGPHNKMLNNTWDPRQDAEGPGSTTRCGYAACEGLESLIRHFHGCKNRALVRCIHCKRMWQLLELHSRMCSKQGSCSVPLCRHFKDKIQLQRSKKEEVRWRLLVRKVMAARGTISSISAWRSCGI